MKAVVWLDDTLFLGHNRSSLVRVDLPNGPVIELPQVTGVTCLGVDSYARKIYWGSLTERAVRNIVEINSSFYSSFSVEIEKILFFFYRQTKQIMRCNVDGSRIERIASDVVAFSLTVDSGRGLIVWADHFGVYSAKLSGKSRRSLYETHINSGSIGWPHSCLDPLINYNNIQYKY